MPNLMSKLFPFTRGGSPRQNFFSQSEHVSSQIWCQNFFPLLRPSPPPKNLRPGTPPQKSETWDPPKNLRPGTPPENLRPGTPPKNLRPGTPPKKLKTWDLGPPQKSETWDPPLKCGQTENITFRHPSDGGR